MKQKTNQQRNRSYKKKNQMEIIQLNNIIIKIKILLDKLNSRVEITENKINEPEDRSKEFTQSEQRENRLGWWGEVSETCGKIIKVTCITGVPEGESKWD